MPVGEVLLLPVQILGSGALTAEVLVVFQDADKASLPLPISSTERSIELLVQKFTVSSPISPQQ